MANKCFWVLFIVLSVALGVVNVVEGRNCVTTIETDECVDDLCSKHCKEAYNGIGICTTDIVLNAVVCSCSYIC
ncbi:hypothetical protein ABFS83_09G019400 [Erythranthe nasuta]